MPVNIEKRKKRYRRQAVLSVILFGLLMLACTACFTALCLILELPGWLLGLFAIAGALCAALTVPALVVLRQRFKEIEGGELDAAAEY